MSGWAVGARLGSVATAVLLTGCGGAAPAATPAPSSTVTVQLADVPSGDAVIGWEAATRRLTVRLDVHGLTPRSGHALHLHTGSCLGTPGPVAFSFPDVTADAAGAVSTTVTAVQPAPSGIPPGTEIDLHLLPAADLGRPPDTGSIPIACTDLGAGRVASVVLRLFAVPGHKPAGTAVLAYDGAARTLTTHLTGFGFAPRSVHAVDIALGTCRRQGGLRYALEDAVADDHGRIDVTSSRTGADPPPPAGWYVLVHQGSRLESLAGGQVQPLFRPVLCGEVTRT